MIKMTVTNESIQHQFLVSTVSCASLLAACASMCERCSMQADNCTRCVACVSPSEEVCERASPVSNCMTECGENQEPNANLYNICGTFLNQKYFCYEGLSYRTNTH